MDPTESADRRAVDDVGYRQLSLTAAQRGMWFAENLSPDYSVIVAQYLDIRDDDRPLDIELFARVVGEVAWQLESTFTRIIEVDGVPMQVVDPEVDFRLEVLDFRDDPDPIARAHRWMHDDHQRTIDLADDRLAITRLIRVADDRAFWYLRAHHIAIDGYAALTSVHEVLDRYNAIIRGQEPVDRPRADLAELVADDAAYTAGTRRETDRSHWAARVADLPERVSLAVTSAIAPLHPVNVVAGRALDGDVQRALEDHAAKTSSSPAVVLTAAFSAYLSRMTGTDDVVLSLPVTGRATARIKRASGMVSNMLPIVARDVRGLRLLDLVEQLKMELTGALRHQRYRFEDIRIDAGMGQSNAASFGPIINMMFFDKPIELVGAHVDYQILSSGILEDLRVNLYQAGPGERLVVDLHGNPGLYAQSELDGHLQRFLTFLERLLADPHATIIDIDLLLDDERDEVHALGRGPRARVPADDDGVLDAFEQQVTRSPDAVAIDFDGRTWTYAQFDALRLRLAREIADSGVVPGERVVVSLPRGVAQVCAVYAVLTVGGTYVPVDPEQPARRRALIAETVGAQVVVDAAYLRFVGFDENRTDIAGPANTVWSPPRGCGGDASAYVIFTSGSTGAPKGVEVGHRAVINRLSWMQDDHPIRADDAILYKTPITFDVSVWELFWPLGVGARMVIARPDGHRDPEYLAGLISERGVSVLHFVPSMLDAYADIIAHRSRADAPIFGPSVRTVFTSGETLSRALADKVAAAGPVELVNLYGPTEAAVDVTGHRVARRGGPVPIGRPVANTDIRVLDSRLRPVPVGVAGELYICGAQLARGYVGRPELTADRFVADPAGLGARMYRTGDLVRWNASGELEYLGRTDFQVKIRGQRVELGEIEAVLLEAPGVDAAVVVARADDGAPPMLVAYLRSDSAEVSATETIAFCRRRLPSHMVPSAVLVLDDFPVNASGKLDRAALPAPALAADVAYEAPTSPVEVALAELIVDLVGVERVGLRDNIFAIGGDSLTAARLVSRARTEHGISVQLTDVFDNPTVGDLARRADGGLDAALPVLVPVGDRGPRVPLSHAQVRLWFINRMDPAASTYNMPGAIRLGADADIAALRLAVRDVLERHESLRTRYPSVDGEPVQQILSIDDVAHVADVDVRRIDTVAHVADVDVRRIDSADTVAHVADVDVRRIDSPVADAVAEEVDRGFDLVDEIGFRWALLADDDGFVAVVVLHHISADGFSLPPLIRDLRQAYDARRAGRAPGFEPLPIQYADFALWQHRVLGDAESPTATRTRELEFWRSELAGMPELLALPTDRPRPEMASGRGGYVDLVVDADLVTGIRALARSASVTPFAVVHAALAAVLARLADTDEVAIGTAVAGREDELTADLVGMFVNTVVLRTPVPTAATVTDLLSTAHTGRAHAMSNAHIPFERVVDAVAPQRSFAHTPLFQVALTMQTDRSGDVAQWTDSSGPLDARVPAAKYDLAFALTEHAAGQAGATRYDVEISYATDLFDESTVAGIGDHLITMLRGMTADPHGHVAHIDLLPPDQVAALTEAPHDTVEPRTLRELLAAGAAAADPASPALVGDETEMTWSVFDARTDQLARELVSRGARPGTSVAISISRSVYSVFAAVAVAKTGAAFVAIDPRHPEVRRREMLEDAEPVLGLTVLGVADEVPDGVEWLVIDDEPVELQVAGHRGTALRDDELLARPSADDTAYLIYTSGSTGRPKATAVTHRGLANLVANQRRLLGVGPDSSVLHVASPSFDASMFELTMALCTGGRLVVSPADVFGGAELGSIIATGGVTHAVMTPSALSTLEPQAVPGLSTVVSVGEPCPPELMRRWVGAGRRFLNLYGPTEATIWATATGPMRADDVVTIGTPVPGVGALVLDRGLRPVPAGVPGELYLTGTQLARGYHGRTDLTAGRFVADPFTSGARMYRTGDRVVRTSSGALIYYGRSDFQIKIRGQRIEPGEVDAALMDHPGVGNALSLGVSGPAGETTLVSYVTIVDEISPTPQDLLDHAASRLPAHLVPHTVVIVDAFELSPVGKIDRAALPPVDISVSDEFVAPRSEMEAVVADIFAHVLGVPRVGVHHSFFDLGGNSLSATKVASRLAEILDSRVPVRDLFEKPTAAGFAAHLTASMTGRSAPPLTARTRAAVVPVSGVQRGMWLLNRADPESANYNVALALRLSGDLDVEALRAATIDVIRRHESLRTTYPMMNSVPKQMIVPADVFADDLDLRVVDVAGDVADEIARVTGAGFDIVSRAPVRMSVLRNGPEDHVLVFVVHHISADGASMAPLARDLMTAYAARLVGAAPAWEPLDIQYADFTLWQSDRLAAVGDGGVTEGDRQLQYWTERLAGAPDQIELPTDRPRPRTPSFDGDVVEFEIPADLVTALGSLARASNTTLFMVTHAAFAVLLGRITGKDDLVIGTPYAGRGDVALEAVVGMFVNTLALRTRVSVDESFSGLLDRVRNDDLVDMAHGDVAFDDIAARVLETTPTSYNPLFQVMFAFQNIEFPTLELDGLRITPESDSLTAAKVDLQLTVFPRDPAGRTSDGAMKVQLLYATDLFDAATIERLAQWYLRVLDAVTADPVCIVGDIVLDLADPDVVDADDIASIADPSPASWRELVSGASATDPEAAAVERDGYLLTFGELESMTVTMATVLPDDDPNAALTMALMSLVPDLAAAGPDALHSVIGELRSRAAAVTGAGSEASGPNVTGAGSEASGPNVTGAGSEASGPNVTGAGSEASGPDQDQNVYRLPAAGDALSAAEGVDRA
ncbi:non-ribosomal peptide synthetase [Gordonia insulae]|uniref:Dimodular nonribosomal peptide synthase n=1 Tax=Gordonia insulae TaxID=2420509 RepID=A0A3G8JU08_9ACTN|nr:non-ribosomal peptide synthetase [Gordonia insulae]AZG48348.1 Dimodular nonribosomal peptide synthase [Gordonia insulae]